MSTVVIGGGATGGLQISLAGIITTAVNIAIIYFLFHYVRRNWNTITSTFKIPNLDFSKFSLDMGKMGNRENYEPQSTLMCLWARPVAVGLRILPGSFSAYTDSPQSLSLSRTDNTNLIPSSRLARDFKLAGMNMSTS